MKRFFVLATISLALVGLAGTAAPAEAAVTWPARCTTFKCVNAHVNQLRRQFVAFRKSVRAELNCERTVPLTPYGDPAGTFGYVFDSDGGGAVAPFYTPAFDVTLSGDAVYAWFVIDACNTTPTAPRTLPGGVLRPHLWER